MTSHAGFERPELARSATWPPAKIQPEQSGITCADTQAFKEDLDEHPERHFLSPMTFEEVYGWDSDSDDDDDDDAEWNAGITDFALFASDRKRAMETGEALDEKWDSFMANQAEAFERSVERVMESESEEVPELTPDVSPHLKDDLEDDDDGKQMAVPQIHVPNYLTVEVKPAQQTGAENFIIGPDDELPLSFWFAPNKRIQRPGLKHTRTMSGRKHVWRRPGDGIFTVGEEVEAEEIAEREDCEMRRVASTGAIDMGAK